MEDWEETDGDQTRYQIVGNRAEWYKPCLSAYIVELVGIFIQMLGLEPASRLDLVEKSTVWLPKGRLWFGIGADH